MAQYDLQYSMFSPASFRYTSVLEIIPSPFDQHLIQTDTFYSSWKQYHPNAGDIQAAHTAAKFSSGNAKGNFKLYHNKSNMGTAKYCI